MIPSCIKAEHLDKAICRIRRDGVPPHRKGRYYCLVKDHCHYPPKYTVALAHEIATGRFLDSNRFSGGAESNGFLRKRGYEITDCNCGGINYASPSPIHAGRLRKSKSVIQKQNHNEHCPACKVRVRDLLERIYGECLVSHRFDWQTHLSSYTGTPIYSTLCKLALILEKYRGFALKDFVKTDTLAACDFWVPDPGFILEFDERQHFTTPRKLTLHAYPDNLTLGFSGKQWISHCEQLEAKDNDPPFRDEQRAWYDALRDLLPSTKGLQPTVRLYARDMVWCSLDPDSTIDQQRFSSFIGYRSSTQEPQSASQTMIKRHNSAGGKASVLRAALVFPQVDNKTLFGIVPRGGGAKKPVIPNCGAFAGENVDFVIFPEGYIRAADVRRLKTLKQLAADLDATLLVGATEDNDDLTGRTCQILLRINPDGTASRLYTKHSKAEAVAFGMHDWQASNALPTFDLSGVKSGATICHDQYLGLLPRFLSRRGARIWINPSYDNVVDVKWSSILRLRAVENRVFSLCTLHDSMERASWTHPFGFSPDGNELTARRAGTNRSQPLSDCIESENIYVVDLDTGLLAQELDWKRVPKADDLSKPRPKKLTNASKPIHLSLIGEHPAILSRSGWVTVDLPGCALKTVHGSVYVGIVPEEQILDAAACFRVIDRAKQADCRPIIWNVWDALPAESARMATLMLGRTIECCAPILISDRYHIHELVELSNNYKNPTRRTIEASGEAIVNLQYAKGLDSAFKMVSEHVNGTMKYTALDRYRSLA